MTVRSDWTEARTRWEALTVYRRFEHVVVLILTALIAVIIMAAVWNLAVKIVVSLLLSDGFDPTEHAVFQAVFGMIFTVIIALEFKRSILVVTERQDSIVQVMEATTLGHLADRARKLEQQPLNPFDFVI